VFNGSKQPTLNRAWIDELLATANSAGGLQLVPEPDGEVGAQNGTGERGK
jgi:hypothetical protein